MKEVKYLVIITAILLNFQLSAQNAEKPKFELKPVIGMQLWSTYSMNHKVLNSSTGNYEAVNNRQNFEIRRSRLGVKGNYTSRLSFSVVGALDVVGRDLNNATYGGANNGSSPSFRIWNFLASWKAFESELLYVTAGYQNPQLGLESFTGVLDISSFDKSDSQFYVRRHLVGTDPGRAVGVNFGGILLQSGNTIGIRYDLGVFNPLFTENNGNSSGKLASNLMVYRIAFNLGEPHSKKYSTGHKLQYDRKGITIGIGQAFQGNSSLFSKSTMTSLDFLANYDGLTLDGEYSFAEREKGIGSVDEAKASFNTYHLRASYMIKVNDKAVEPMVMINGFNGEQSEAGCLAANTLKMNCGQESAIDVGVNYHFNNKIKLMLHYVGYNGDRKNAPADINVNNYFYQNGVGQIERGDYIGLGLVAKY
ncbi:MAG: porin [Saprospiraceae bacterium]